MIQIIGYDKVNGSKFEHVPFDGIVLDRKNLEQLRTKLKDKHQCNIMFHYKEKWKL